MLARVLTAIVVLGAVAIASPPPPSLLKNVNPGAASSQAFPLVDVNGTLFFAAVRNEFGKELWKSDGTTHGTVMVKDVYPGTASVQDGIAFGNSSLPGNLTNVAGTLFFNASSPGQGGLWKSDGTEAGTVFVTDLAADDPVAAGNRLFFTSGDQLFVTDGTGAGTVQLSGLGIGMPPYNAHDPVAVGTTVYFVAADIYTGVYDELWKTDGTVGGTSLVTTFGASIDLHYRAGAFAGALLFPVCNFGDRCQLWRSDGTVGGTFALTSIPDGVSIGPQSPPVDAGALAFFIARHPDTGGELWKTDGTVAGTSLVIDLVPGWQDASINTLALVATGGNAYFVVQDYLAPGLGGLWRSDGTEAGTVHVVAGQLDDNGLYADALVNADGTLLFRMQTPDDRIYLWRSDGTPEGSEQVAEILGHYISYRSTAVGGALFFVPFAGDPYGPEPMIYLASCGNGTVGTGEACDDGAMNGVDGICTTACTLVDDVDDDGVPNASDNCPDGWNPGQEDTDGDGEGDACEACVGGDTAIKAQLKLSKLDTPAADDKLTMKGIITIPTTPAVAPDLLGAIVRIEDNTGGIVLDAEIPAFEYDSFYKDGWKTNSSFTSFTYLNQNLGGFQGLTKVGAKFDPDTGIMKFTIKGKNGSFAFDPMKLPLTATFALSTEKPVVGQCGVLEFPNAPGTDGSCTLKPNGSSLKCK